MQLWLHMPWPVGEMVNTLPSQGNIHGFEPHTGHHLKRTQVIHSYYLFLYLIIARSIFYNNSLDIRFQFRSLYYILIYLIN